MIDFRFDNSSNTVQTFNFRKFPNCDSSQRFHKNFILADWNNIYSAGQDTSKRGLWVKALTLLCSQTLFLAYFKLLNWRKADGGINVFFRTKSVRRIALRWHGVNDPNVLRVRLEQILKFWVYNDSQPKNIVLIIKRSKMTLKSLVLRQRTRCSLRQLWHKFTVYSFEKWISEFASINFCWNLC